MRSQGLRGESLLRVEQQLAGQGVLLQLPGDGRHHHRVAVAEEKYAIAAGIQVLAALAVVDINAMAGLFDRQIHQRRKARIP